MDWESIKHQRKSTFGVIRGGLTVLLVLVITVEGFNRMEVDLAVVLFIGLLTLWRVRDGFARSVECLVGTIVALTAALIGYQWAGSVLTFHTGLVPGNARLAAFAILIAAAYWVPRWAAAALFKITNSNIDRVHPGFAALPAVFSGALAATAALTLVYHLPFIHQIPQVQTIRAQIEESVVARAMVYTAEPISAAEKELLADAYGDVRSLGDQADSTFKATAASASEDEVSTPESKDPVGYMITLINQERMGAGLGIVALDEDLSSVALAHSQDMAANNFFSHESPTWGDLRNRLRVGGLRPGVAGENLATAVTVAVAHEALMNSPHHKANILNSDFNRVGIGMVQSGKDVITFTQVFSD